jgi:hypothetical protein
MNKKLYHIGLLSLLIVCFTSCKEVLDIEPRQSIEAETALDTQEGIEAAVNNVYSVLKAQVLYGRDLLAISECLADNARIINRAGGRFFNEGSNIPNAHFGGWATYYSGINQCNLILKELPSVVGVNDAFRNSIEGQVKTLRALFYFNLSRIFAYEPKVEIAQVSKGGVPILKDGVLTPDQITYPSRNTVNEVYAFIYQDLNDAVAKAPNTGAPSRITKAFAQALFAQVALYNQDYTLAAQYATDALNARVGTFVNNLSYITAWRERNNPEAIFEILFRLPSESLGVNNSLQSAYTTRVSLGSNTLAGWGAVVPTDAFLALMGTNDIRRQLYQAGVNRSNVVATECTKFLGKAGNIYMDNIPVMRVSELYLIRAEALARSGRDENQARADVNQIRTRAGLTAIESSVVGTALINEIMLQRRIELAFEGQRWFDLKRLGQDVVKTTGNVPYGDFRILAPIPTSEIIANKNLVQNANY